MQPRTPEQVRQAAIQKLCNHPGALAGNENDHKAVTYREIATPDELRAMGFTVQVGSYRRIRGDKKFREASTIAPLVREGFTVDPRGGATAIHIETPLIFETLHGIGAAKCSARDKYKKSYGVRMATRRALLHMAATYQERADALMKLAGGA